jgi:exonuclease III
MTNCRSLNLQKKNELELIIQDYSPDILALTETWMTTEKESFTQFCDYNLYTANRINKIGGGCCLLVRSNLTSHRIGQFTSERLTIVWIKINYQNPRL